MDVLMSNPRNNCKDYGLLNRPPISPYLHNYWWCNKSPTILKKAKFKKEGVFRVIHYKMHNRTKCIIFSLIISPFLPASTMTTSTKAYRMQLALAELKQQEKPNVSITSKKYQFVQFIFYHH